MNITKQQIVEKIKNYLGQRKEIKFAYIFGSFVKKEKYRDIDVAVYVSPEFDYNDLSAYPYGYASTLIGELTQIINSDKLDLVIMNRAGIVLLQRIVNNSIVLFASDKYERINYENNIRKEYIDSQNLRVIKRRYLSGKLNA